MEGFGVPVSVHSARGTSTTEYYGEPAMRAVGYTQGVPAPFSGAPGPEDDVVLDEPANHCSEITKKGGACKAPPAKGTAMCIGHLRGSGTKGS